MAAAVVSVGQSVGAACAGLLPLAQLQLAEAAAARGRLQGAWRRGSPPVAVMEAAQRAAAAAAARQAAAGGGVAADDAALAPAIALAGLYPLALLAAAQVAAAGEGDGAGNDGSDTGASQE